MARCLHTIHTFSVRIIRLLFFARTWGVPLFCMRRDEGEAQPHSGFTVLFDNPTNTVRENGTVVDEGKAASRRHTLAALLFVALAQRSRVIWRLQAMID